MGADVEAGSESGEVELEEDNFGSSDHDEDPEGNGGAGNGQIQLRSSAQGLILEQQEQIQPRVGQKRTMQQRMNEDEGNDFKSDREALGKKADHELMKMRSAADILKNE